MSLGKRGSMDAPLEFLRDRLVAFAASGRDVELKNRGFRIFGVENLVCAVAVGANGCLLRTICDSVSMHARLVRRNHLRALAPIGHDKLLAVAGAAGGWDVGMTDA